MGRPRQRAQTRHQFNRTDRIGQTIREIVATELERLGDERRVAEEVQQGKGTVGGLLRDPTVYQDLKLIVGNVKRNTVLKALVRAAIRSEGLKRDSSESP